jgi:hypothetical protein
MATKNPSNKKANVLTDVLTPASALLSDENKTASLESVCAPVKYQERFMYVTSLNLRRSILKGDVKHCKLVVSRKDFRALTAAGLNSDVTWDEIVRAMIAEQLHQPNPFASCLRFLPEPGLLD